MTKIEREYMMSLEIDRKRLADDLAALRIEHAAWGTLLDVTRKDRDALRARVAELERLQVSIHKAADAARKAERADVVASLDDGICLLVAEYGDDDPLVFALSTFRNAVTEGAHEGAAGRS